MRRVIVFVAVGLYIGLCAGGSAEGAPAPSLPIPQDLQPWVSWVLHDSEDAFCAFPNGVGGGQKVCQFSSRLELLLSDGGGSFKQEWTLLRAGFVVLPGDQKRWPMHITVDGKAAVVIEREQRARIWLPAGEHRVAGKFLWDSLPDALQIPPDTGLLTLTVGGKGVTDPRQDDQGRLWLQQRAKKSDAENRLEVRVHRKVVDEIPLELHTRIELNVAGSNREVLLAKPLPPSFLPLALNSKLPARLEADGRLRVQLRPGRWHLELAARHQGPAAKLSVAPGEGPWAAEEVWVFEARNHLRQVTVKGVASIDPQQTTLPPAWKRFPTYRMGPKDVMVLDEQRRGDSAPTRDALSLQRTLWLDFDGGGLTIADEIRGTLNHGKRLEMQDEVQLGRVAIDGKDQFITKSKKTGVVGVEIQRGRLAANADSRIEGKASDLLAVGWNHDFHTVSANLNLPPGWRLFHASGVDQISSSWIKEWSLLDLFLILLFAIAVAKLFSWRAGILTLLALGLAINEPQAPRWIWAFVLVAEGLHRLMPEGWLRRIAQGGRVVTITVLVVTSLPFIIQQLRQAMHPSLQYAHQRIESRRSTTRYANQNVGGLSLSGGDRFANVDKPAAVQNEEVKVSDIVLATSKKQKRTPGRSSLQQVQNAPQQLQEQLSFVSKRQLMNAYKHDPTVIVQTGPGLPQWGWNRVALKWSGPVAKNDRLHLTLLSPAMNLLLALIRALGLVLLIVVIVGTRGRWWRWLGRGALSVLAFGIVAQASDARAEFPNPALLDTLKARLVKPAKCYPDCASAESLELVVDAKTLRLKLEVSIAAPTAIPLPGQEKQWLPQDVVVDNLPASALFRREGHLWLFLKAGRHQVELSGAVPNREVLQLALPLKPHRVTAKVKGWAIDGLHEDGLADDNIQLTKIRTSKSASQTLQPGNLPPFAQVFRSLSLGLSWQVETVVQRQTPSGSAMVLEVPLLDGESVTTADIRVQKGHALINMGPEVNQVRWSSVLRQSEQIALQAPKAKPWREVWQLNAGPIWHVETSGIPRIQPPGSDDTRATTWRPWPGEKVVLNVTRPKGIKGGRAWTVDRVILNAKAGQRATDTELELHVRSSRGEQHALTLPKGAQLQSVKIDGTVQPIHQDKQTVRLSIVPGKRRFELSWRQPKGIATRYSIPELNLAAPAVNTSISIRLPSDRWVIVVGGAKFGPAIRYWAYLIALLVVGVLLGRFSYSPLKTHQWILLGIGLSQISVVGAAAVGGWFLFLRWRERKAEWGNKWLFDLRQLAVLVWTLVAMVALITAIHQGLLGQPDMQIAGNGSSAHNLRWFIDRTDASLAQPWVISLPIYVYRVAMLLWALWLAWALIGWLRWGWGAFGESGMWRRLRAEKAAPLSE